MTSKTNMLFQQESRSYAVELATSLGKRIGKLKIDFFEDHFSGILSLMKADNPIHGQRLEDGTCILNGTIRTMMNTYPFEGEGFIQPERIELLLHCAGVNLPLLGIKEKE